MATVTGLTKDRMLAIEAASVVSGLIDTGTGHLMLTTHDGTIIDAGYAVGAFGPNLTAIGALTPVNDDFLQYLAGVWTNITPAQVKAALTITEADVANLVTDLAGKAPIVSPVFTGQAIFGVAVHWPVTEPVSAGHVSIDANQGDIFDILADADFTLDNPINSINAQIIHLRITQDATGGRLITLDTAWNAGPNAITLSTGANKRDHLVAQYHSGSGKWDITGFRGGY